MVYIRTLVAAVFLACGSQSAIAAEPDGVGMSSPDALRAATLLSTVLRPPSSTAPQSYPPTQKVRACGASGYSCDDIAFPNCLWDTSEEGYYCAPDDVTYCEYDDGWDYWCSLEDYCCGENQCCN